MISFYSIPRQIWDDEFRNKSYRLVPLTNFYEIMDYLRQSRDNLSVRWKLLLLL